MQNLTPLMKQYWEIKNLHRDKILMFRMGDFFEIFYDDAIKAAPILGIALTQRNKKSQDETPMCGMPHHSVAGPINKLLAHGLKVAICDQIEDPQFAKGLVKRAVTRILTPGMVYDPETLDASLSNYLCCFEEDIVAMVDVTTGEAFYYDQINSQSLPTLLEAFPIAEFVLTQSQSEYGFLKGKVMSLHEGLVDSDQPTSLRRLLSYVHSLTSSESLMNLRPFEKRSIQHKMKISPLVQRHLELFQNARGDSAGSFFDAIQRTKTSVGSRLLRQWIQFPLYDKDQILQRQSLVEKWMSDHPRLKKFREILSGMGDLERRLGKLVQGQSNGRDLYSLASSIQAGLQALSLALDSSMAHVAQHELLKHLDLSVLDQIVQRVHQTLLEEQPLLVRQGHLIQKGVDATLDELIELATNSQALISKMEMEEKQSTGISSLKIRYNNVFGYYIEITHLHKDKVPSHYQRKQTLANAERFCTPALLDLERKVLTAQSRRADLEYEIFSSLKSWVIQQSSSILILANILAEMDVLTSFAWLSMEQKYVRPVFTDGSLHLVASRHPVVEQHVRSQFVANDLRMEPGDVLLITGPNMAGKSTVMRQVGLIALMAQMGCFVSCEAAKLPLFDAIFTRIGASDFLSEGLSTFMVEMTETSNMLQQASSNSLLILDEIGRGTSTFDGMALAQSILEYLATDLHATALFATHYHELTRLHQEHRQIRNAHMTVSEKHGEIRFLHTLVPGPAAKSYGIQVAKLAGMPSSITRRASDLLKTWEKKSLKNHASDGTAQLSLLDLVNESEKSVTEELVQGPERRLLEEIRNYPLLQKSPLESIQKLMDWQSRLSVGSKFDKFDS
jgi:DNA mismatch repair protein MutS